MTHRAAPGRRAFTPAGKLRKLSPLTPVLEMWAAVAAVLALVFFNLIDVLADLYRDLKSGEVTSDQLLLVGGVLAAVLAAGLVFNYLAWLAMGFRLTDDAIVVHSGVLFRTKHHVRLDRVQTVDVVQPLIARPFQLGEIAIEAAGGSDSKASIRFLPMKDIELDRAEILEAVRRAEARARGEALPDDVPASVVPAVADPAELQQEPNLGRMLYGPIGTSRILGSTFLSSGVWAVLFAVGMLGLAIYLGSSMVGAIAAIIAVVQTVWGQVNRGWRGRGAIDAEHLNLVYGLTEERKQSIPIDRIHALEVSQPFLWRFFGWWQVKASVAGYGNSSKLISSSTTLLPVGSAEDMFAVTSALQTPSVWQRMFLHNDVGWQHSPRQVRWVSPFDADWQATRLDGDGISIRSGWLTRRWTYIPYPRVQGFTPKQGPIEQLLGVTTIEVDLVPGPVHATIQQQPAPRAAKMVVWLHRHCVRRLR
ncbi:PH domain-containing protein [Corynebacterium ulceribovis]|uniref:PH domain-containing protein n=1 Tax=Corynebacterium ulceribovis TaxID=487732 RepID=UPI0003805608|nr:PH domain-containing protein [Corynebacterium ulceribovis]